MSYERLYYFGYSMTSIMMELDKKKYLSDIKKLCLNCFDESGQYSDFYFANLFSDKRSFGIIENGALIAISFVSKKKLVFDDCQIDCPLISFVAVDRIFRNKGYAFKLIEFIKQTLRNENYLAVYLSPVNPNVYIKNLFIPFCSEYDFEIHYDGFGVAVLKEANSADIPRLLALYNNFCLTKNAFAIRNADYFEMLLKSGQVTNPVYLIVEDERVLGYIYSDGTYWEVVAQKTDICKVKELDGKVVSMPDYCEKANRRISQMLCFLDEKNLKIICPNIEKSILNHKNFNFDKY